MNIPIDKNALRCDLVRRIRFTEIQAGIDCFRVLRRHLPEGILDAVTDQPWTSLRAEQPENAESPIEATPPGRVMDSRLAQP